ncbi:two-component system sensor histidine kinase NtrB [Nitrospira sp. NS4]|uniref:two-component system sensor histidine kinase NtrB n=1 Tax=Nitrospira sp. NS4 TaxID=3414498 RepID=UPI003C2DDF8A
MNPDALKDEGQFRLIVDAAPNGMLLVNKAGTIVMANACVLNLFGYQPDELIGQSVEVLLPPDRRAAHPAQRTEFHAHMKARSMGGGKELFGLRRDGTEFPVEVGLTPIDTGHGRCVLASVVDITERKRLEAQLRRAERLAELGTLASGMAHEIGTPMNVILGRAEYLMERTKEEGTKKGLQTIVSQVERITRVMNQLLAFARRSPIERAPLDLRQTVQANLEMFEERLVKSRINVELALSEACPLVYADRDQMSQVFINLLMNAIHAMPDGGVLRLTVEAQPAAVLLTLRDTGHGIPPDVMNKIFEPFFTTKEFGKGTGLGLTVVKGILEEHGGSIHVASEIGQGTTVTLSLPITDEVSPHSSAL